MYPLNSIGTAPGQSEQAEASGSWKMPQPGEVQEVACIHERGRWFWCMDQWADAECYIWGIWTGLWAPRGQIKMNFIYSIIAEETSKY